MGQCRNLFPKDAAVFTHVFGAHLEQIVKSPRDHVAHFDLGDSPHGIVKSLQRRLAGVAELDLDEGDIVAPQHGRIQNGAKTGDIPDPLQALEPDLTGRLGQPHLIGQRSDRNTPIQAQNIENLFIKTI